MYRIAVLVALLVPAFAFAGDHVTYPKGAFTLHAYAAYTDDVEHSGYQIPSGSFGAGWYVANDFAIGAEANVIGFLQGEGDDTTAYNISVFLRHHFIDTPKYTVFFDVLFGPEYSDDQVPGSGTYFNYLTRLGIGATTPINENTELMGGIRWFHMSNANTHGEDENPSINGVQYYLGVIWKF